MVSRIPSSSGVNENSGRIFRPREGDTLILFLKDVNLVKPDKWGTSALVTFLQQLLTYRGFHVESLEWVGLEGVQIVISINPSSTLGRCELTTERATQRFGVHVADHEYFFGVPLLDHGGQQAVGSELRAIRDR